MVGGSVRPRQRMWWHSCPATIVKRVSEFRSTICCIRPHYKIAFSRFKPATSFLPTGRLRARVDVIINLGPISEPDMESTSPNASSRDDQGFSTKRNLGPQSPASSQWPGCVRDFLPTLYVFPTNLSVLAKLTPCDSLRFTHAEVASDMAEIEKSFSKQTAVRVLARIPETSDEVQEIVLDNNNYVQFQQVSRRLQ